MKFVIALFLGVASATNLNRDLPSGMSNNAHSFASNREVLSDDYFKSNTELLGLDGQAYDVESMWGKGVSHAQNEEILDEDNYVQGQSIELLGLDGFAFKEIPAMA